ncbi:PaaI family thioesterase [Maricurvus nonylphenolicus]
MMELSELREFIDKEFPQSQIEIEAIGEKSSRLRLRVGTSHLRPGGTVSGPSMMLLGDCALYVAILSEIGRVALAVTTSFNINFLNKPSADKDLIAECKLLKLGSRLVIGEVTIYSDGLEEPVAHAVGTYSIPPDAFSNRDEQ